MTVVIIALGDGVIFFPTIAYFLLLGWKVAGGAGRGTVIIFPYHIKIFQICGETLGWGSCYNSSTSVRVEGV